MKPARVMAITALIATTGLVLHVAQAEQVGARRIDLQRDDLSVTGREVVQTIVELAPGATAPRHSVSLTDHPEVDDMEGDEMANRRVGSDDIELPRSAPAPVRGPSPEPASNQTLANDAPTERLR